MEGSQLKEVGGQVTNAYLVHLDGRVELGVFERVRDQNSVRERHNGVGGGRRKGGGHEGQIRQRCGRLNVRQLDKPLHIFASPSRKHSAPTACTQSRTWAIFGELGASKDPWCQHNIRNSLDPCNRAKQY